MSCLRYRRGSRSSIEDAVGISAWWDWCIERWGGLGELALKMVVLGGNGSRCCCSVMGMFLFLWVEAWSVEDWGMDFGCCGVFLVGLGELCDA